ncbi:unnamed protein product [Dibothriocephalus latus]|uniref:Uncharacterized protein n=1 Tax=Dibothriocephalus latus TaxID=60516 RepID=A0A3P7LZH5_DIBLA|nr:unnamed protein product [Dibothriocephalus latus]
MDQESHSNLAHGTSAFQNNALSHDNSDSVLNAGYSIPGDPSHLQQQLKYGSNAHSLQQIHPGQVSSTSTQGTDLPGTSSNQVPKFQPGASEVTARVPTVQNPVNAYMVPPSCPVISNHLEVGGAKPPAQRFVGTSATLAQSDPDCFVLRQHSEISSVLSLYYDYFLRAESPEHKLLNSGY